MFSEVCGVVMSLVLRSLWCCNKSRSQKSVMLQLKELRVTVDGLEKERDFYFGKLRDIEVICQENESDDVPVLKNIMDILYATEVG